MNKKAIMLTRAAMIAALYVVLTWISNIFGLASGSVQFRVSEALTVLPIFMPESILGLTVGCLLANILTGSVLTDIVFGTLATLIGACVTYKVRKKPIFAITSPVVANTVIIPFVLAYSYNIHPIWLTAITVGAGELVSVGTLGTLLFFWLKKNYNKIIK